MNKRPRNQHPGFVWPTLPERPMAFTPPPDARGMARVPPEKRAEICAKGGAATKGKIQGYKFTSEAARAAGLRSAQLRAQARATKEGS